MHLPDSELKKKVAKTLMKRNNPDNDVPEYQFFSSFVNEAEEN
jgi:hypothetical protein